MYLPAGRKFKECPSGFLAIHMWPHIASCIPGTLYTHAQCMYIEWIVELSRVICLPQTLLRVQMRALNWMRRSSTQSHTMYPHTANCYNNTSVYYVVCLRRYNSNLCSYALQSLQSIVYFPSWSFLSMRIHVSINLNFIVLYHYVVCLLRYNSNLCSCLYWSALFSFYVLSLLDCCLAHVYMYCMCLIGHLNFKVFWQINVKSDVRQQARMVSAHFEC